MSLRNNVLIPTEHGLMLVNRQEALFHFGVSKQLLENGVYERDEIRLITDQVKHVSDRPVCLDIGANIGVHTIELANAVRAKGGVVHSFEAQRIMFQMMMANVAINNLNNVYGHHCAVGARAGQLRLPAIDYSKPASFGSIELGSGRQQEDIGHAPDWEHSTETVDLITIDSLKLERVDIAKIDVEGMELQVLAGAEKTIGACKPLLFVEHLKSDKNLLLAWLREAGYRVYPCGPNYFGVPRESPIVVYGAVELQQH
jgi:FkbM family methyltransferase